MDKICSTCRFWEPSSASYGTCNLITEGMLKSIVEIIVDSDTKEHRIDTRLETYHGFGCIEWRQYEQ